MRKQRQHSLLGAKASQLKTNSLRSMTVVEMSDDVMGRGVNWSRIKSRDRMRRQGVEDIKGETLFVLHQPPKQRRRKLSKAELREQAAAAFLAWREGQTAKDK